MGKYLKTKEGSIESAVLEAMSPAQQAAIAISKKEKEKREVKHKVRLLRVAVPGARIPVLMLSSSIACRG